MAHDQPTVLRRHQRLECSRNPPRNDDVAAKIDLDCEDDTRGGDLEPVDVATKIDLDY